MRILSLLLLASLPTAHAADRVLLDFSQEATLKQVQPRAVQMSLVNGHKGPALKVVARTGLDWPGVTFPMTDGLDVSQYGDLVFTLKNPQTDSMQLQCRIDSRPKDMPGAKELDRTTGIYLKAGETKEVRIPLLPFVEYHGIKKEDLIGMRGIPFFQEKTFHLEHVSKITFFLFKLEKPLTFEVGNLRLEGTPNKLEPAPEKPFPLIDRFGQFIHRDWPGKTHSVAEMLSRRDEESMHLASTQAPASWDRFGGWKDGPQLEATGFFRTAKHEGKWQLVDPDGHLFFSLGIDGVGIGDATIIDERKHWFEGLPPDDEANKAFYLSWMGNMAGYYYFGKNARGFNFSKHNLMLKYGGDWQQSFYQITTERLPAWGINTLGNHSDHMLWTRKKTPYTVIFNADGPPIEGTKGYWGKFVDPFHPDFMLQMRQRMKWKQNLASINDPWCIGYFVDNELSWGDTTALALGALASPPEQKAKQVFIADLKAKYDTITALNEVWKTAHASWDAMLTSTTSTTSTTSPAIPDAKADLEAFSEKVADTYFIKVRKALKEYAPNHLYLGCRLMGGTVNPIAAMASTRHCDVVSFNIYEQQLADHFPELQKAGDKPYLVGEFHYGALDRGLFHTGLVPVKNQADRAEHFTRFVTDCLKHPNIVGCHWFQFSDSPTTGRLWDGENYQIGFTDVCDTPYAELITASRTMGESLYQPRTKQ